jgi:hypothetical protein
MFDIFTALILAIILNTLLPVFNNIKGGAENG